MTTRRQFLTATTSTLVVGLSHAADKPKYKYIDIHTHVGTFYFGRPLTADDLVRMMDRHAVEKAVVLPLVSPESAPYIQTTESALAAHKAHPDRLIPFCCLDPRSTTGRPERFGHVEAAERDEPVGV